MNVEYFDYIKFLWNICTIFPQSYFTHQLVSNHQSWEKFHLFSLNLVKPHFLEKMKSFIFVFRTGGSAIYVYRLKVGLIPVIMLCHGLTESSSSLLEAT